LCVARAENGAAFNSGSMTLIVKIYIRRRATRESLTVNDRPMLKTSDRFALRFSRLVAKASIDLTSQDVAICGRRKNAAFDRSLSVTETPLPKHRYAR
jgi:hypothetical protein